MEDEERDESSVLEMQKKIRGPLGWDSPSYANINDLREIHYDDVLGLIKHHFFKEDPMCKASFMQTDEESMKGYLNLVTVWMKDSTSLVATSSISGRVIAAAITRINSHLDRTNTYSRVQIFEGKTLEKMMHLKSQVVKQADAYNFYKVAATFRVYLLCCHPSYQNRGLESALLETCIDVASVLGLSAIVGVFTSGFSQDIARNIGFRTLSEIRYSRWIVNDEIVFRDPGIGNYSAAFMGMRVPDNADELLLRQQARRCFYEKMPVKECRPTTA